VVGNSIWNTSHYCNFFQIFTDFELFKRFELKLGLTNLWSIKVIATALANQPELHFGKGSLQGDLKTLNYHLVDMHKLTLQIQIVMAFQSWLLVKLSRAKFLSGNWIVELSLGPPNKYFPTSIIFVYLHTCRASHEEQFLCWE
jgi:hypothetical protein